MFCFGWFSFGAATGITQKIHGLWPDFLTIFTTILASILTMVFIKKTKPSFIAGVVASMLALSGWQIYAGLNSQNHIELLFGAVFALIAGLCVIIDFPIIWEQQPKP